LAALKAHHFFVREEIGQMQGLGSLGDAIGWAEGDADGYRRIIVLLAGYVDELEQRSAAMHRTTPEDASEVERERYEQYAREAERRGSQARAVVGVMGDELTRRLSE
jgi:hypothetical protein